MRFCRIYEIMRFYDFQLDFTAQKFGYGTRKFFQKPSI